jgi:hypothetical protein
MPQQQGRILIHADFETWTLGEWHPASSSSAFYAFIWHVSIEQEYEAIPPFAKATGLFLFHRFPEDSLAHIGYFW